MKWKDIAARLDSVQDQDMANAVAWFAEASDEAKLRVWFHIQRSCTDDMDEIISRFAQLGMTQAAIVYAKSEAVNGR